MPPKFRRVGMVDDPNEAARRSLLDDDSDEDIFDIHDHTRGASSRRGAQPAGHDDTALRTAQREVDEAVDVMKQNIGKVLERGGKLDDLEDKSEVLMQGSFAFQRGSRRLTRELWWKRTRARIIIGLIVAAILAIIILVFVLKKKK
ncbi:hypothetical protein PTSG_11105 [Salpingoeca rosetta]|uniref:V-SNARE coiled-coil homology domain-containing protein n=1 Tax=Salpingoeca rosetta (strain ATCC 50818 / BSB-021) TaxID=946362 RepID=F2US56_SALR5|nr:uncharacterized protein PTSG_11105 [Salpingoeca rosetta]EGD80461.1 hypothetical protein PTSG_11105 [Salpingoeca rosetta]|eukprot:XP_004988025.1 hypothetical protein PTSG_11105 [Salpingoeca rosetta]